MVRQSVRVQTQSVRMQTPEQSRTGRRACAWRGMQSGSAMQAHAFTRLRWRSADKTARDVHCGARRHLVQMQATSQGGVYGCRAPSARPPFSALAAPRAHSAPALPAAARAGASAPRRPRRPEATTTPWCPETSGPLAHERFRGHPQPRQGGREGSGPLEGLTRFA